jgi:hypothetical protein
LQDKAVVLGVPSITVRGETLHTPQLDYCYLEEQAVEVAQLEQEVASRNQHLRPLS